MDREVTRRVFGIRRLTGTVLIVIAVAIFTIVPALAAAKAPFKTLPADKVDGTGIAQARAAAVDLLTRWASGKYEPLSNAFAAQLQKAMTPESQRKAYSAMKSRYGDFRSLEYVAAATSPDHPRFIVYRFKGDFSGTKEKLEVRVLTYAGGKVAGFWVRPWKDEIQ